MATMLAQPRSPTYPWQYSPSPAHHHTHATLSSSSKPPSTATLRPPARKIRFAPLPDPRRSVLVTDDGQEFPIPSGANQISSCSPSPALALHSEQQPPETASLSSFGSSKRTNSTEPSASGSTTPASMTSEASGSEPNSPASTPLCLPPSLPSLKKPAATPSPTPTASTSVWSKSKGVSFFRSFKRSSGSSSSGSSYTLTPTNSNDPKPQPAPASRKGITTEEILTLGTINLFRTSSRDSGEGWNLTRWASAGPSSSSSTGPARNFGVPLTRTQSTQSNMSHKSKTPSLLSGLRYSTASTPKPAKKPAAPVRKGTRMLNGRVYGSKQNPNANPFANARDDDTSFVEWGYGGMGSVRGAKNAGVTGAGWEKLGATAVDDDLEDATGTAWVRKRREAREKKAREELEAKEKAEKAEQAANGELALPESPVAAPASLPESDTDGEVALKQEQAHSTASEAAFPTPTASSADLTSSRTVSRLVRTDGPAAPSTPTLPATSPSRDLGSPFSQPEDDHVFKTLSIPPRPPHRSRSASNATFTHPIAEVDRVPDLVKAGSGSESESETESETDGEDSDDEEESEDDEEEAQKRKMVIGAGMEKVSWHRAEAEEHA